MAPSPSPRSVASGFPRAVQWALGTGRRHPPATRLQGPGTVRDTWGGSVRHARSRRRNRRLAMSPDVETAVDGRNPTWYFLGPRDRSLERSAMVGSGTPSGFGAVR